MKWLSKTPISLLLIGCDNASAKDAVRLLLKDPDSAQFEAVASENSVVCGLVNAKNAVGGFVGYRAFIVKDGIAEIETEAGEFATRLPAECARETSLRYIDMLAGEQDFYDKITRPN